MSKKNPVIILVFLFSFTLFARENLDSVITKTAKSITDYCLVSSTIVIDDFESPSAEMTLYIREQLADSIFENGNKVRIVTREHMDKIENELRFQNSGKVSTKSILSVAERLGAQLLIFGSFEEKNEGYVFRIRMLDVKIGTYLFRKSFNIYYSKKVEQLLGRAPIFKRISFGITGEVNKNSLHYFAPGAGFSFDYALSRKFAVGSKIIVSYDFQEKNHQFGGAELLGTFRYYAASINGEPVSGVFAEAQAGTDLIFINSNLKTAFSGGVGGGCRFTLKNLYFEPEIRLGYPYIFGGEISVGLRF